MRLMLIICACATVLTGCVSRALPDDVCCYYKFNVACADDEVIMTLDPPQAGISSICACPEDTNAVNCSSYPGYVPLNTK